MTFFRNFLVDLGTKNQFGFWKWHNFSKTRDSTTEMFNKNILVVFVKVISLLRTQKMVTKYSNTERRSTRFSVIRTSLERERTKRRFCSFLAIVVPTSGRKWCPVLPNLRRLCLLWFGQFSLCRINLHRKLTRRVLLFTQRRLCRIMLSIRQLLRCQWCLCGCRSYPGSNYICSNHTCSNHHHCIHGNSRCQLHWSRQ